MAERFHDVILGKEWTNELVDKHWPKYSQPYPPPPFFDNPPSSCRFHSHYQLQDDIIHY